MNSEKLNEVIRGKIRINSKLEEVCMLMMLTKSLLIIKVEHQIFYKL